MKAINHTNKDAAASPLFSCTDTKLSRPARWAMYAILDDTERPSMACAFNHPAKAGL